jgi:DNA modification methylase
MLQGDCRDILPLLPTGSIECYLTSPPYYGQRDYVISGQIGREIDMTSYLSGMDDIFNCLVRYELGK